MLHFTLHNLFKIYSYGNNTPAVVHQDQQGRLCWSKDSQKTDFSFYAYVNVHCKWTDMVGCNSQSGLESAPTWPYIEPDLKAWLEKHNFQNIWILEIQ